MKQAPYETLVTVPHGVADVLNQVPGSPIIDGRPAFGTYAGRCGDTDLELRDRGVSRIRRAISEKRWQWFSAFDDHLAVGGAIVDAGVFGTAFLWVFDRERGELLVDGDIVVPTQLLWVSPHPTAGQIARIDLPRYRLEMNWVGEQLTIEASFAGASLSLAMQADDNRAITAICPVPERTDGVNVTQKEPSVPVSGAVSVEDGNRSISEREFDGVGFLDYSHGLLGRTTRWDWAFATCEAEDGTPVWFNLVDRFNEGYENVVWVDGEPRAVGKATLTAGEKSWHVSTDCGTVDATLAVEGARSQDIDVGLIRSSYHQPLGYWSGTVAGHEITGVGVAEEHLTRW